MIQKMRRFRGTVSRFGAMVILMGAWGCSENTATQWSSRTGETEDGLHGMPLEPEPVIEEWGGGSTDGELDRLRRLSLDILLQAGDSENPLLRANALEAMQAAPEQLTPLLRRGLADANRGVRFVAAMSAGRIKAREVSPQLRSLLKDKSDSVRAAAMYALTQCDQRVDLNPLASMLHSGNTEVKANAAMILGELGNSSAVPLLRQAAGRGLERASQSRARLVDLQIAEAMVKLGEDNELEVIRAALFSLPDDDGELIALACQMCGELTDHRVVPNLQDLARREGSRRMPAEIRMAATMALAKIVPAQTPVEVPLGFAGNELPELRHQAALTLGELRSREYLPQFAILLQDSSPLVQVAAAGSILKIRR